MTKPKKLLAFFFLLLPFASSVNAEEEKRDFKRELCASIGAKAEKITEKVYSNGNMISELVWADTVDAVFDVSLDLNFCGTGSSTTRSRTALPIPWTLARATESSSRKAESA